MSFAHDSEVARNGCSWDPAMPAGLLPTIRPLTQTSEFLQRKSRDSLAEERMSSVSKTREKRG